MHHPQVVRGLVRRSSLVLVASVPWAIALGACGPSSARVQHDAGNVPHDSGLPPTIDARVIVIPDAGLTGGAMPEQCMNGIDDDRNGLADENCACEPPLDQACWTGDVGARNTGVCRDGHQTCFRRPADEFGFMTVCADQVLPTAEDYSNSVDDDCDGRVDEGRPPCTPLGDVEPVTSCDDSIDQDCDLLVDCDDPDCADAMPCWGGPCPPGQGQIYGERNLGSGGGGSSIDRGDGMPIWTVTCGVTSCGLTQATIQYADGRRECVEPPPSCGAGESASWVPAASGAIGFGGGGGSSEGHWRCDGPCEWVVTYGGIFANQRVCAPAIGIVCAGGETPTFVYESREWQCRPTCDNGLYDLLVADGAMVCVPC